MEARRWTTIAIAAATLAVTLGILIMSGRGSAAGPSADAPRSGAKQPPGPVYTVSKGVALIDARNGLLFESVSAAAVARPAEAAYDGGSFWVFDVAPPAFVQIDAANGNVIRHLRSPFRDVGFFTVSGSTIWVTNETSGQVAAIDARDGHRLRTFSHLPGRGGSAGVVLAHGSLWVARPEAAGGDGILLRLDPRSGAVEHMFRGLTGSYALSAEPDGIVWTAGTFGAVNRIDPVSNGVVQAVTEGRNYAVAAGNGTAWTADSVKGVVYQVDANGDVISQHPTAAGALPVAYSDGVAWIGNTKTGTLTRIDSADDVTTYEFDHSVISLAAGSGTLLVGFGAPVAIP